MRSYRFAIALLFSLLFSPFIYGTHTDMSDATAENGKPATIKILIKNQVEGTLIEAKGAYKVYNPESSKILSSGYKGKRYYLYPHKDGLKWGEGFPGIYQIRIVPSNPKTTILVDGIEYRGSIECYHFDGKVSVINEVDIESYIKSILTQMLPADLHDNVYDALTIVARTNAYYTALKNCEVYWHVDAEKVNYQGHAATLLKTHIDRAVDATRYLVMTYEEMPFPALWVSDCAGKTASFQTIFRKKISCPDGIESPFAAEVRAEHRWSLSIPRETLAKIARTNRVTGVDTFIDENSGKIYAIRIKDGVHHKDLDFLALQKALGENELKSNDFKVSVKEDTVLFEGFGEGHGVGLCIYSASCMAKKGEVVPHILGTFFPLSHLVYRRSLPSPDIQALSIEKQTAPE